MISGGTGNVCIDDRGPGRGNENLTGGSGNDLLYGGPFNNTFQVTRGNNRIFGGPRRNFVGAGFGHDVVDVHRGHDNVVNASRFGKLTDIRCHPRHDVVRITPAKRRHLRDCRFVYVVTARSSLAVPGPLPCALAFRRTGAGLTIAYGEPVAEYEGTEQAMVSATAQRCFDALTDFERLPEWQRALRRCTVVSREKDGRGAVVDYEVDARVSTVRFRLANRWEAPRHLDCEYLEGDFRSFRGGWTFDECEAGRTEVTLMIAIDPGRFVPRPVAAMIRKAVLRQAVDDLRRHVERTPAGARRSALDGPR